MLHLIPPTSNDCDRLVSECKYVLLAHRKRLLPIPFGWLIFLNSNAELWDVHTVAGVSKQMVIHAQMIAFFTVFGCLCDA